MGCSEPVTSARANGKAAPKPSAAGRISATTSRLRCNRSPAPCPADRTRSSATSRGTNPPASEEAHVATIAVAASRSASHIAGRRARPAAHAPPAAPAAIRSEEHTSELQSRLHLVCRLLLEKKKKN